MGRKVAVLVRDRQQEALRVALGLTLCDNAVQVCLIERRVAPAPGATDFLPVLRELGVPLATTCGGDAGFELLSPAELARRLLGCDHVLTY